MTYSEKEEEDFVAILLPIFVNGLAALPTCVGAPDQEGEGGEGSGCATHFVVQIRGVQRLPSTEKIPKTTKTTVKQTAMRQIQRQSTRVTTDINFDM